MRPPRHLLLLCSAKGELGGYISRALEESGLRPSSLHEDPPFVLVEHGDPVEAAYALKRLPGLSALYVGWRTSGALVELLEAARLVARSYFRRGDRVAIRALSHVPTCSSEELELYAASALLEDRAVPRFELDYGPDALGLWLVLWRGGGFVALRAYEGIEGEAYGSAGRAVALLSPSRRSVMAAWLAIRRGYAVQLALIDNRPYADERELEALVKAACLLREYMPGPASLAVYRLGVKGSVLGLLPLLSKALLERWGCEAFIASPAPPHMDPTYWLSGGELSSLWRRLVPEDYALSLPDEEPRPASKEPLAEGELRRMLKGEVLVELERGPVSYHRALDRYPW